MKRLILIFAVLFSLAACGQVPGIGGMVPNVAPSVPIETDFITEWVITANTLTLPTYGSSIYAFDAVVEWGDGTTSEITSYNDADLTHYYASNGTYQVNISGTWESFSVQNGSMRLLLRKVINWGDVDLKVLSNGFMGCNNLNELPDASLPSSIMNCSSAFRYCYALTALPESMFSNVPNLTSLYLIFGNCTGLVSIPETLFDYSFPNLMAAGSVFKYCSNITSNVPAAWNNTYIDASSHAQFYYGCTNASNYASIPVGWK